jgi:hypothetical protein
LAPGPVLPGQEILALEPGASPASQPSGALAVRERTDPQTGRVGSWVTWSQVTTLMTSTSLDRHYTLDRATGRIAFGDGVNGLMPPRGAPITAVYRYGGGLASNVPAGAVTRTGSVPPQVVSVSNPGDADGGADAEQLDLRDERGPAALRHRQRAVTAADMTWMAREVVGGRVARCLVPQGTPRGRPALVVVTHDMVPAPAPTATLLARLEQELSARASLDLAAAPPLLRVTGPAYRRVRAYVVVEPVDPADVQRVKADVVAALDGFFDARRGGPDGQGWPIGRAVYESEVAQVLLGVPSVGSVHSLSLASDAMSRRLALRSPVVMPLGLPRGSRVARPDGSLVFTLDEPLPAGAPITALAVRGPTDGDLLRLLVDVVADQVVPVDTSHVRVALRQVTPRHGTVPTRFPSGSSLVDSTGQRLGLSAAPLDPVPSGVFSGVQMVVELADGVDEIAQGIALSLVHPATLRVVAARGSQPDGSPATGAVLTRMEGLNGLSAGDLLGQPGAPLRVRVASDVEGTADADAVEIATDAWTGGDGLLLSLADPDAADEPVEADVLGVELIDDVVYLDPGSLVCPDSHVVQISGP